MNGFIRLLGQALPSVKHTSTFWRLFLSPLALVNISSLAAISALSVRVCKLTPWCILFTKLINFFLDLEFRPLNGATSSAVASYVIIATLVFLLAISKPLKNLGRKSFRRRSWLKSRILDEQSIKMPRSRPCLHGSVSIAKDKEQRKG